jgi:CAAX protease family protein
MSTSEYTAPAPAESRPVEYATFSRRLGAALLDSLVWIVGLAFFNPFAVVGDNEAVAGLLVLIVFSAWFNYFAICEWLWGQTIGKNALGIRVLPLQAGELSWQAAAVRNLLRIADFPLSMLGIDYLIVQRSERRQRLGDRAAKTIVVRERAPQPATSEDPLPPSSPPPTAGELFGDAAAALERHPAAGSRPATEPGTPPGPLANTPVAPASPADVHVPGLQAPARTSWTAAGFPYPRWEVKRTLLGLVAGLLIGGLFAPLLVLPFDPDLSSTWALLVAQALLSVTLVVVAIQVASGDGDVRVREDLALLGLRRFRASAFGWLAAAYASYFAFIAVYASLVTQPDQEDIARDLGLDQGVAAAIPVVFLIAVAAPIAEEIFFRGMLFGGLRKRLSTLPAAAISALVFGALHATTGVSAVPPLIIFGFVLALLYERTGSLVPGMLLHALNNALALAVAS